MIEALDAVLGGMASRVGLSKDLFKLMFCLLVALPMSAVLKQMPESNFNLRIAFLVGGSLFFLVGVFDLWWGLWTLSLDAAVTYVLAARLRSRAMPWIVFVFLMGHMVKSVNDDGIVDITAAQMVLLLKLSGFAWNVYDGRADHEKLTPRQRDRMLLRMPSIRNYIGYVFFFPTIMIGPSFDYVEYRRWLDLSIFDVPTEAQGSRYLRRRRRHRAYRSGRISCITAAKGLCWMGLFAVLSQNFSTDTVVKYGPEFSSRSFVYKLGYLLVLALTHRTKYYGAWGISDAACVLIGISFNGVDARGRPRWDRVVNVKPLVFEKAQNTKELLDAWNINTSRWLKYCVYLRVTPRGKAPGLKSSLATFATSALWHGTRPGYFLAFITAAFAQVYAKMLRKLLRPFTLIPDQSQARSFKVVYDFICWLATQLTFAYIVQPFVILDLRASLTFWSRYYYFVHLGILALAVLAHSPAWRWIRAAQRKYIVAMPPPEVQKRSERRTATDGAAAAVDITSTGIDEAEDKDL